MKLEQIKNFDDLEYEFSKWRRVVNNVNRYYDDTPLLDLLYNHSKSFKYDILHGQSFYRGRIFDLDNIISSKEQFEDWLADDKNRFQGYDSKESGAPPSKYATEGRLNGQCISFLYTCSDIATVIYELRPTRGKRVSVAKFITNRNLVFADLTVKKADSISVPRLSDLLRLIAREFSVPHYAGYNYSFTQYLAEHLMNLRFNGVIFESSLNPDGENFVFFNPEDCRAINSRLYEITDIEVKSKPITRRDFRRQKY